MINRAAVETHCLAVKFPREAPAEDAAAFRSEAIDLFCGWFEEHGWPSEMPNLVLLPPYISRSDPLAQRGYAGMGYNGEPNSVLWCKPYSQPYRAGSFTLVEKNKDGKVIW